MVAVEMHLQGGAQAQVDRHHNSAPQLVLAVDIRCSSRRGGRGHIAVVRAFWAGSRCGDAGRRRPPHVLQLKFQAGLILCCIRRHLQAMANLVNQYECGVQLFTPQDGACPNAQA